MLRLALAFTVAVAAPSSGAPRVVVAPDLRASGGVDDAARAAFLAGVQEGVEASGAALVAPKTLSGALVDHPEYARCDDDRCWLALAAATKAQAVVAGEVGKDAVKGERERARYTFKLRLYDAEAADFTSAVEDVCGRCTEPELQTILRDATKQLFAGEKRPPTAPLAVSSTPPDAEVRIDGRLLGLTDLVQPIAAGAHHLSVEKRGLQPADLEVALVAGTRYRVAVRWPDPHGAPVVEQGEPKPIDQVQLIPVPSSERLSPSAKLWIGVGSGTLGVGLAALGIGLIAVDGHGTCPEASDVVHCPNLYKTAAGGWISLIGGIALVATGVTVILLAARHK